MSKQKKESKPTSQPSGPVRQHHHVATTNTQSKPPTGKKTKF